MELVELSECQFNLLSLLRPRRELPLPSLAFDLELIYLSSDQAPGVGPTLTSKPSSKSNLKNETKVLNLSNLPSARKLSILSSLYSDLGVFELLRLTTHSPDLIALSDLENHFHIGTKPDNSDFLKRLTKMPRLLQNHFDSKKLKFSELSFLRAWDFKLDAGRELALAKIAEFNLTLQQSLKALELIVDLILMERQLDSLIEAKSEAEFQSALLAARYPVSTQIEKLHEQAMQSISWPAFAKAKTVRRGDRTGFEVQAFLSSESDIIKLVSTMERVKVDFKNSSFTDPAL